jgi:hypothetical protein
MTYTNGERRQTNVSMYHPHFQLKQEQYIHYYKRVFNNRLKQLYYNTIISNSSFI